MDKSILVLLFIFLQLFNNCKSQNHSLQGFYVYTEFPEIDTIINNKWEVRKYTPMFTKIYYNNDLIMIQQSFTHTNIEMVNDVIVKQDTEKISYYSLVYSDNSTKSVLFDSCNIQSARVVNKDSILNTINVIKDNIKTTFETTYNKLLSSEVNSNGYLEETYSFISKSDSSMAGSFVLKFSGKNSPEKFYQISPSFENKRNMRLLEFIIKMNERRFGEGEMLMGPIVFPQRVEDIKIDNEQEILKMFNHAKEEFNIN